MYTIICTKFTEGSIAEVVEKIQVKSECERLKKVMYNPKLEDTQNTYVRIEVVNNNTGEIREFWNNKENTINFQALAQKEPSFVAPHKRNGTHVIIYNKYTKDRF